MSETLGPFKGGDPSPATQTQPSVMAGPSAGEPMLPPITPYFAERITDDQFRLYIATGKMPHGDITEDSEEGRDYQFFGDNAHIDLGRLRRDLVLYAGSGANPNSVKMEDLRVGYILVKGRPAKGIHAFASAGILFQHKLTLKMWFTDWTLAEKFGTNSMLPELSKLAVP